MGFLNFAGIIGSACTNNHLHKQVHSWVFDLKPKKETKAISMVANPIPQTKNQDQVQPLVKAEPINVRTKAKTADPNLKVSHLISYL